ncbi:hypothetical protein N0V93_003009 [Gnomoniopsis smithogilvyi]|uniref:BTB domain-containing protein n=1 Tax=Gnomoniopsis smithogilvyi TaxID=1191159 RepID=A0A9W9CZQ2_9PEZI|nr:hypothetical protein N0V93_003009 [Gnomoniopsis smithogilvyi]
MSSLWRAWVDQDVDRFRRLLAPTAHNAQSAKSPHIGSGGASPGALGTSPRTFTKSRKASGFGPGLGGSRSGNTNFGRSEVNSRDHAGLTILLRAASATSVNAIAFVQALLEHPAIDLHIQDPESGWNALHRALYAGNISIARLLLDKERDLTGQIGGASVAKAGRLIRTKDHEGFSPFDLYNSTIAQRDLQLLGGDQGSDDGSEAEETGNIQSSTSNDAAIGSELFTFGSNKNLTLGLGDEDDRQFPERVYLQRPTHLLQKFYDEYLETARADLSTSTSDSLEEMPTLTRYRELFVQDVVLSKYHSAILTTDPVSNLYVCGIGRGGRLGLGDENTRFNYTPVQGGLANKKVIQIALGHNHTMAVTEGGELWNWGTNANSVLGYSLPEPANKGEEPFIAMPRQVFGSLKKEIIVGIAASTIHSVAHTGTALYCWGKNVGQLALMDADSRSLEVQLTPRRVAASLLSAPILQVSAIDKATTCLLANHSVIVFTAYGYNVVKFPFGETLTSQNMGGVSMSSRYDPERNRIKHITSGGETIVALTGRGDLFHMNLVTHKADATSSTSTTNPSKIKGAVSQPVCIWTAHKDGVSSVDVGEHGSVIISTLSGAVWRRVKRAKAKDSFVADAGGAKQKDFKFQRVPGITNIVTVRSSAFGAFAAIRKDAEVMREQIKISPATIWADLAPLNSLKDFKSSDPSTENTDKLKFWDSSRLRAQLGSVAFEVLKSPDLDQDLQNYLLAWHYGHEDLDAVVCTSSSPELKIPVHGWLLAARSPFLRHSLCVGRARASYDSPECLSVEVKDGKAILTFAGVDIISLLNLVLFIYEDRVIAAWNFARQDPSLAYRYRQVRTDVTKLASRLEMSNLEAAAQKQTDPERSLNADLRAAIEDPSFFDDADAILNLDGGDVPAHSSLLRQRSPFFEALFHGRSQGAWLGSRRAALSSDDMIPVDLEHIEVETFQYVLRYLYADVGSDLFDDVVCDNVDDFSDLVMDVLNVANELMLDRLSQICQQVISRFVNTRNIAHYLNAISPCAVTAFKDAGLEYIALQAENFLENNLLESLDEEVIEELDAIVRDNQLAHYPFARSGRAELLLHEQNPELAQDIEEERQRRVKEMAFRANQKEEERKLSSSLKGRFGSLENATWHSPSLDKQSGKRRSSRNEPFSPELRPKSTQADLMFDMDDDEGPIDSPSVRPQRMLDMNKRSEIDSLPPLSEFQRNEKQKVVARSPMDSSPAKTTPIQSNLASRPAATTPGKPSNPWAPAVLPTAKLDLRKLMGESSGPSALSTGLAAQKAKDAAKPQQTKVSQKERKKQQQLQAEQAAKAALAPPAVAWEKTSADTISSPWKTVSSVPKSSLKETKAEPLTAAPSNPKPLLIADASAKSITRRTQSPDTRHSGQSRTPITTPPVRPPPQAKTSHTMSTFSADDPSKPIIPHSKSYIKPASKSESTLGLSMADIIDLERRKQEAVKEAAAKRSLMEIQQEQEFSIWWEEESRRTQEEEARRLASQREREEGKARGRRGRSGKAARGGRGGAAGSSTEAVASSTAAQSETTRQHGQESGRGRGNRRGRGRGGAARAAT